jgi:protease-4
MNGSGTDVLHRLLTSYAFYAALGAVVGLAVAPVAYDVGVSADGTVAVVPVTGGIDGEVAANYTDMMREAREDPSIDAVVVVSNSGGGSATASETMYLQTKRTAAEMPVVASVDGGAASGAYYTVVPADTIYAKPASIVGSVGVRAALPQNVEPNDVVGTTGPNKLTGGDSREFFALLESLQTAFLNAVYENRGDRIDLTRAELAEAQIYSGTQAVQNGLADRIGDRESAVRAAAEAAGLSRYDVELLRPDGQVYQFTSRNNYLAADVPDARKQMVDVGYFAGDPGTGPAFLMLSSGVVTADRTVAANTTQASRGRPVRVATRATGVRG